VAATFAIAAANKGISLDLSIEEDIPPWLSADPVRLRQVLVNLIGNAIKFTSTGGVKLTCRRVRSDDHGPQLAMVVEDTGIGMSENALGRLFQPFTQADGSTTRRYGGTGLGLSISLRLAQLMNGRIDVRSTEGKGSTFTVHLPLIQADAPPEMTDLSLPDLVTAPVAPSAALDIVEDSTATGPIILVAEDNRTNRWVIQQQLNRLGYRVHLTENGCAALGAYLAADEGHYALIITDYHMPEMDGLDLTRAVRQSETGGADRMPIVALTANAMPAIVDSCHDAGIDDVLTKPTELSTLSEMLDRWIAGKVDADVASPVDAERINGTNVNGKTQDTNNVPVLDTGAFTEIFGGINETVRDALSRYLNGGAELAALIDRQAVEGDAAGLAKTAHKLAGESLSAGAMALGHLCKDLERAAMADDWEKVSTLRPRVGEAFGSVKEAITAI
jgi:CheY-like chemotaxis protein/HPt (histidine-containing phosphotransfer) domain-containing protein